MQGVVGRASATRSVYIASAGKGRGVDKDHSSGAPTASTRRPFCPDCHTNRLATENTFLPSALYISVRSSSTTRLTDGRPKREKKGNRWRMRSPKTSNHKYRRNKQDRTIPTILVGQSAELPSSPR